MKYPEDYINKIICGDSLTVMRQMPDNCLDLVITSPPYNLRNSTGNGMKTGRSWKWPNAALRNGYSHHSDNMPHEEYVKWQHNCLQEMFRLIKEDGAIFYNHIIINGESKMVYFRIGRILFKICPFAKSLFGNVKVESISMRDIFCLPMK